jgi:hypothetical protein
VGGEITLLPKPKLKITIICPFCGHRMTTYRKRIKRVICEECRSRIDGSDLANAMYYYKEGKLEKYVMI